MSAEKSLSARGFVLASILDKPHGSLELVLKIMDLEDKVEALRDEAFSLQSEKSVVERRLALCEEWPEIKFPEVVQISEWVEKDGETIKKACGEDGWRQSLSQRTKLDIRAVLGEMPKTVGFYISRVIYQRDGEILQGIIKFWVVPVLD